MSAVSFCAVCDRPLDDDRKRRADAVTCSRACRTALWRARRKIRRAGGVPYIDVNGDGYGSVASFEPPASPGEIADTRFRAQLAQLEEATRPLTDEERRERSRLRDLMRRNPGVLLPPLHDRLLANGMKARAMEDDATRATAPIRVEDRFSSDHDPTVVARRGIASRQANRHLAGADPNSYVDSVPRPYTSLPPGPSRYPRTPENTMINAPNRNTPKWAMGSGES